MQLTLMAAGLAVSPAAFAQPLYDDYAIDPPPAPVAADVSPDIVTNGAAVVTAEGRWGWDDERFDYRPDWGYADPSGFVPGRIYRGKDHGQGFYRWRGRELLPRPAVHRELQLHAVRMGNLKRLMHLARAQGRPQLLAHTRFAIRREMRRHEIRMARLLDTYPHDRFQGGFYQRSAYPGGSFYRY